MKTASAKLLGIGLAITLPFISADCNDELPFYLPSSVFQYPSYGGRGNSNNDVFSENPYRQCTSPADFYEQDFSVVSYCFGFFGCRQVTCEQLLSVPSLILLRPYFNQPANLAKGGGVEIPNDDVACCSAQRYKDDEEISYESEEDVCISINIAEEYGSNASTFTSLCEELFACTSYVEQVRTEPYPYVVPLEYCCGNFLTILIITLTFLGCYCKMF